MLDTPSVTMIGGPIVIELFHRSLDEYGHPQDELLYIGNDRTMARYYVLRHRYTGYEGLLWTQTKPR